MKFVLTNSALAVFWIAAIGLVAGCGAESSSPADPSGTTANTSRIGTEVELLNVANDPTRELWKDLNSAFAAAYQKETGTTVRIRQSHASSGSQARAVVDGLEADVVTLAVWPDTDQLRKKGLIKEGWEDRLPRRRLPYSTPIVFVVRQGNPKGIKDWSDFSRPDIEIITPNPKTSGNGKLAFLAAWGSVVLSGGTEQQAREFVTELYKRVPVLDTGARGSTTTFAQKGLGDVHLAFESEAHLEVQEAQGKLEIVYPSVTILAEPHVAVVDLNVDKKRTREAAEAYLKFVYTAEGQAIVARHFYRPNAGLLELDRDQFPELKLFSITEIAKDWEEAQEKFFAEGALFDSIYRER